MNIPVPVRQSRPEVHFTEEPKIKKAKKVQYLCVCRGQIEYLRVLQYIGDGYATSGPIVQTGSTLYREAKI